jgi:LysM repeat protein
MIDFEVKNSLNNPFYDIYEIKKGDSLYQISKEYNVNTKLLAQLNGLELDDYIYPEQMLLIPKKDVSYYITKQGDTLNTVSKLFNVNEDDIISQNKTIYLQNGQMIFYKRD